MEHKIITVIEVHEVASIFPSLPMRQMPRLKIKVTMDRFQLAALIRASLEELTTDELNEVLNSDGINITCSE